MVPDRAERKMAEIKQYLEILTESLEKKKALLQKLQAENTKQADAVRGEGDMDAFDKSVKMKGRLIRELNGLDRGFEKVYDRIREELPTGKTLYQEEIKRMQTLISEITELSMNIQASEQRNRQLVENYFSYTRSKIRQAKMSVKAASGYYKSMSNTAYAGPQLMDKKK